MLGELLRNTILQKFPQVKMDVTAQDFPLLIVAKDQLYEVAKNLKEEESLDFDFLSCLSGVDYLDYIELVYHLYSYSKKHFLVLKTSVTREDPEVVSLCSLWSTADWQEREVYDLFGVIFSGHPNLRRILLPEDFPGHPFRRDYPLENNEEYLLKE